MAEEAKKMNCRRVSWVTEDGNAGARSLYDSVTTYGGHVTYRLYLD